MEFDKCNLNEKFLVFHPKILVTDGIEGRLNYNLLVEASIPEWHKDKRIPIEISRRNVSNRNGKVDVVVSFKRDLTSKSQYTNGACIEVLALLGDPKNLIIKNQSSNPNLTPEQIYNQTFQSFLKNATHRLVIEEYQIEKTSNRCEIKDSDRTFFLLSDNKIQYNAFQDNPELIEKFKSSLSKNYPQESYSIEVINEVLRLIKEPVYVQEVLAEDPILNNLLKEYQKLNQLRTKTHYETGELGFQLVQNTELNIKIGLRILEIAQVGEKKTEYVYYNPINPKGFYGVRYYKTSWSGPYIEIAHSGDEHTSTCIIQDFYYHERNQEDTFFRFMEALHANGFMSDATIKKWRKEFEELKALPKDTKILRIYNH